MTQALFSSRLATFLSMVGVAVGLGNVWRFPYMMGRHGGSAFLLVYMLCMLAFAIPALCAEWALARATRSGPLGAFRAAFGAPIGSAVGALLVISISITCTYYVVVIAYVTWTAYWSAAHGFAGDQLALFQVGLANGPLQYAIALALLAGGLYLIYRGVRAGIEAASRVIVPLFALVVLWLAAYTLSLDGAAARLADFLRPDFSSMGPTAVFAALGQACFSLGVGGNLMIAYGSYLESEVSIPRMALFTGLGDMGAALLAAVFIVPALLLFGIDLAAGPTLIFSTLPALFARMPLGRVAGCAFLGTLALIALLSAMAAFEVAVMTLERWMSRKAAVVLFGVALAAGMLLPALRPSSIDVLDLYFGSGMQTLGAALAVIALTWGLGRAAVVAQLRSTAPVVYLWLRYVVPAALLLILAGWIRDTMA